MRVLFVHSRMVGGGIERITLTLIEEFQKRGIDCCLALRSCHGDLIDEAQTLTDVVELAPSGIKGFIPRLTKLVRNYEPTCIVTAVPDISVLTMVSRRLAGSNACLVQGVHITQAHCAYADTLPRRIRWRLDLLIARIAYRYVDHIVAVSRGIAMEICKEFSAPPTMVTMIHNPAVRESFIGGREIQPSATSRELRFITIGRLSWEKGLDVLIRALGQVGGDWRLDIYGTGSAEAELAELVEKCGLRDRVFFRGHTDDTAKVIDASDWLMLPSRVEGFGVVLIESLARGVPVVASDCPYGPREILDGGRYGLLVSPDDVDALATAIRGVIDNCFHFEPKQLRRRAMDFVVSQSVDSWYAVLERTCRARQTD